MSDSTADNAIELGDLGPHASAGDWISRLLQIPSFSLIAPLQLQAMFLRMQKLSVEPGEIVLREGTPGDYFYVIAAGRCAVSSMATPLLAELQAGDYFGEEALLTRTPRNASVTMLTRGQLMRLARKDFLDVLRVPAQRRIDATTAQLRIDAGQAQWLDVGPGGSNRGPAGANTMRQIPLEELRQRLDELDPGLPWILGSKDEGRNAVAYFLLGKRGIDSFVLEPTPAAPTTPAHKV